MTKRCLRLALGVVVFAPSLFSQDPAKIPDDKDLVAVRERIVKSLLAEDRRRLNEQGALFWLEQARGSEDRTNRYAYLSLAFDVATKKKPNNDVASWALAEIANYQDGPKNVVRLLVDSRLPCLPARLQASRVSLAGDDCKTAKDVLPPALFSRETNRKTSRDNYVKWLDGVSDVFQKTKETALAEDQRNLLQAWLAMAKSDWRKAIELLAKCNDKRYSDLASAEGRSPIDSQGRLDLAKAWQESADKKPEASCRDEMSRRAACWYGLFLSAIKNPNDFKDAQDKARTFIDQELKSDPVFAFIGATIKEGCVLILTFDKKDQKNPRRVADSSVFENNGVIIGKFTSETGLVNSCLKFEADGENKASSTKTGTGFPVRDFPRAVSAWVKVEKVIPKSTPTIFRCNGDGFNLWLYGATPAAGIGPPHGENDKRTFNVVASSSIVDGRWHHLAVVYEGNWTGMLRIYVDGQEEASKKIEMPEPIGGDAWAVGHGGSGQFAGLVDEVAFFNRALTADEIVYLHLLGRVGRGL